MATILILDDEPCNLEIMAAILKRQGHAILTASDGEEAILHSRTYPGEIDLVLADVVLRGRTAVEVAKDIGLFRPGVPFLFVSGYPKDALREVFAGAGLTEHTAFLQKPFTLDRLVAHVNARLGRALAHSAGAA